MKRRNAIAALAAGLSYSPLRSIAQEQGPAQAQRPITLDVNRVNLLFTVSDKKGRFVTNLTREEFEIVESKTWQLRHPVGPDALPFLSWRKAMSDEEWVNWGALDDEAWYDRVQADFGLDARAGTQTA